MRPPTTSEEGGILVVTFDDPSGLNDGRADAFRQALYEVVQAQARPLVAADLGAIDYLSSSGVALLVGLKRRVDAHNGTLVLYHLQPYVYDVLRVTKLTQLFTIAPDRESAFALLSPSPA
jgi:anti-sigma B factor antagonist